MGRTLLTAESKYNIKIQITHHRVMGNGSISEGISLMNTFWVGHSVFYQDLRAANDTMYYLKKCFMEK